jgi:hypothetical protein
LDSASELRVYLTAHCQHHHLIPNVSHEALAREEATPAADLGLRDRIVLPWTSRKMAPAPATDGSAEAGELQTLERLPVDETS